MKDIYKNQNTTNKLNNVADLFVPQNIGEKKVTPPLNFPHQLIYYGAPGTGKSYTIDELTDPERTIRTTFHPDSDYASFVGAYKPTMTDVRINSIYGESVQFATGKNGHPGTEKKIVYKYVPQAFLKAYVAAWSDLEKPYFLVVEEINRGNCAQIFGDLFQLLDRNNSGASSYAIAADEDIAKYLASDEKGFANLPEEAKDGIRNFVLKKDNGKTINIGEEILNGTKLLLPPNLYIWATMNTSDQSLFPIDSAFKRRWNWKYVPIAYDQEDWLFAVGENLYKWGDFLKVINPIISKLTGSPDKQMGFYFAKPDERTDDELDYNDLISEDVFLNKVLFYLWTDVLKDFDAGEEPFINSKTSHVYEFGEFFDDDNDYLQEFVDKLNLETVDDNTLHDSPVPDYKKNNVSKGYILDDEYIENIGAVARTVISKLAANLKYEQIENDFKNIVNMVRYGLLGIQKGEPSDIIKKKGYSKWYKESFKSSDGVVFSLSSEWYRDHFDKLAKFVANYPKIFPGGLKKAE